MYFFNLENLNIYLPIITEKGLFNGGKFHEVIRLQLQTTINISRFFKKKNTLKDINYFNM